MRLAVVPAVTGDLGAFATRTADVVGPAVLAHQLVAPRVIDQRGQVHQGWHGRHALAAYAPAPTWAGSQESAASVARSDGRPLFEQRDEATWFGGAVEGRPGKSGEGVDPDQM